MFLIFLFVRWWAGEWQKCSTTCGPTGQKKRTVLCIQTVGSDEQALAVTECQHLLKPKTHLSCNRDVLCPSDWTVSNWTEVSLCQLWNVCFFIFSDFFVYVCAFFFLFFFFWSDLSYLTEKTNERFCCFFFLPYFLTSSQVLYAHEKKVALLANNLDECVF